MGTFFRPQTILAILAGTIFFSGAFFLITTNTEPVTVAVEDTEFIPISVILAEQEPTPPIEPILETPPIEEELVVEEIENPAPTPPKTAEPLPVAPPAPVAQSFVPKDLELVNKEIQAALVNILCISSASSPVGSISGSGIIIDPSGTILTNAHIAQYLLLKDYPSKDSIVCTIRTGSPAKAAYTTDLAYVSPLWVTENKDALSKANPTGTGKDDFALLTITGATEFSTMPDTFPYLPVTFDEADVGTTVISAGYPASFLSSDAIRRNLVQISAAGTIKDIFTFLQTTVDVLSLGGVPLAQQGASGGAVVRSDGSLIGLVVTSSLEEDTQERDLRAISTGHIARSFAGQHQSSFAAYAFGDINPEYINFTANIAPQLRDILLTALGKE